MSLASLYNVPRDENDWYVWSFANQDSHTRIAEALLSQKNIQTTVLALDPIPSFAIEEWLRRHQQMHNEMDGALGIDASDFTIPDFRNAAEVEQWLRAHADEHTEAENMLGIS